mgnify:FL=1
MDYIYDNGFMGNLRIIVGKTGSGKTNFLQLIGMDWLNREDTAESDVYLLLYKMHDENAFFRRSGARECQTGISLHL